MNRFVLAAVFCALAVAAAPVGAQEAYSAAPQPSNTYNDPAMSFTAPADFKQVQGAKFDPSSTQPTVVATYVKNPGKPEMHLIQIQMESFEGTLQGYTVYAENTLREQMDGVFVGNKHQVALSNGMPAFWEELSMGEGFQEMKRYQYLWVDGVRGVILSDTGRYGEIDAQQAQKELANASGVAFPHNAE